MPAEKTTEEQLKADWDLLEHTAAIELNMFTALLQSEESSVVARALLDLRRRLDRLEKIF